MGDTEQLKLLPSMRARFTHHEQVRNF